MRLALPTVSSVSLTASVCQVFGNDCTEFDFGDHPVTGPRTHRPAHVFCHSGVRTRDSRNAAVPAVTHESIMLARWYLVHFAESSCFDVHCHSLLLRSASVKNFVCPPPALSHPPSLLVLQAYLG